jgi:ADP-ribose pyrophosphatase YjhB (NUDIX family)
MAYFEELRKLVGHRPLILPGAVVIILDKENRILLQQRNEPRKRWGLPGGIMELGESIEETAGREVKEETGLHVNSLHLLNVYSGKNYHVKVENGDEFYVVTIAYYTKDIQGNLQLDKKEGLNIQYFSKDDIPTNIVLSHKRMIDDLFSHLENEKRKCF